MRPAAVQPSHALGAPPPGDARLPHSALYSEARWFPEDSIEEIADRLAVRHYWTPANRELHLDRLRDIRRTIAAEAQHQRSLVPAAQTADAVDDYFAAVDERAKTTARELRELEDK